MIPQQRPHRSSIAALLLVLLAAPMAMHTSQAQTATTNARMQKVLREFVAANETQVIGLGSWISGRNYRDPLSAGNPSDHDMRLLLPKGTKPADAARQWRTAREELAKRIRQEFGSDADTILRSCNLYAPTQLMGGVETAEDAMARFRELNQVPNMAHSGRVGADTSMELAEGLYGAGAKTWTQKYEKDAGRLFYSEVGRAYVGMCDLAHLDEGLGKYTVSGMAGTSAQWIEHAEEAMRSGNGQSLAKYIERLDRDLAKAKDLARCDLSDSFRAELASLASELRRNPAAARRIESKIQSALSRAHIESALLARIGRAGAARAALLKVMLAGSGPASQLRDILIKAAQKIPADQLLTGVFAFWDAKEISGALGEGRQGDALAAAAPYLLPLGPAMLASLANAVLESAKDAGFSLMASTQGAWDLLAGIYSAGGRPQMDNVGNFTLDDLVAKVWDEKMVENIVMAKARLASMRNAGSATGAADASVAQAIYDRCAPIILRAWRARREALIEEYHSLVDRYEAADVVLSYSPFPAKLVRQQTSSVATVSVCPESTDDGEYRRTERMNDILRILLGPRRAYASTSFEWITPSAPGGTTMTMAYTFRKPGTYPVTVKRTLKTVGTGITPSSPLAINIVRISSVLVEVEDGGAKSPVVPAVKPKPVATSSSGSTSGPGRYVCVRVQRRDEIMEPKRVKKVEFGEGTFKADMLTPRGEVNSLAATWTVPPAVLVPGQPVRLSCTLTGNWGRLELEGASLIGRDPSSPITQTITIDPQPGRRVFQISLSILGGVAFVHESRTYDYTWVPAGSPTPPEAVDPAAKK